MTNTIGATPEERELVEELRKAIGHTRQDRPDDDYGLRMRLSHDEQMRAARACLAVVEKRIEELTDLPRLIELNRTAAPDCPREDGWNAGLDYAAGMVRAALPSVVLKGNSNG